jgi:hypothetical protein
MLSQSIVRFTFMCRLDWTESDVVRVDNNHSTVYTSQNEIFFLHYVTVFMHFGDITPLCFLLTRPVGLKQDNN